jgi:DNA-binding PadR family transcriptional regulator
VLYPLLKRMEADGLVRKRVESGGKSPARHVYRPTERGRKVFGEWLRSDAFEEDEVTYDFLLGHPFLAKCLFFSRLEADELKDKLIAQLDSSIEKLCTFERIREGMVSRGVDPFRIGVIDLGIAQQREKVRWLKRAISELGAERSGRRAAA